jgi:hypothetical protein
MGPLPATKPGSGGMPQATAGRPSVGDCSVSGEITTSPGICQSLGLECEPAADLDCGRCQAERQCYQHRCYTEAGPPPEGFDAPLLRGLYADGEGQSFDIQEDGVVERLAATLFTQGADLEVDLYVYCGGVRTLTQRIPLPASEVPPYDFHRGTGPIDVALQPPLELHAGDTFDVIFRAPLATYPNSANISGVSGIYTTDVDPHSHFISGDYNGISDNVTWDYMVLLYMH